jgi:SAM-dependent methyltransferase
MATFDAHADTYEDEVRSSIAFAGRELEFFTARKVDRLVDVAGRLVGDPDQLSVLDVGCGLGLTDTVLEPRVGELHGLDPASEAVGQAQERNVGVRYCAGDARGLPYAPASLDLATMICVLHHIDSDQRAAVAAELARVVKPGGLVVVFEHNPLNPATRVAVSRCEFDVGVELLTQGTTKRLLASVGLDVVEVRSIIFTTSTSAWADRLDRSLGSIPFGAQYYVAARRTSSPS